MVKLKIYIDRVLRVVLVYGRLIETTVVCRLYFMFSIVLSDNLCHAVVQFCAACTIAVDDGQNVTISKSEVWANTIMVMCQDNAWCLLDIENKRNMHRACSSVLDRFEVRHRDGRTGTDKRCPVQAQYKQFGRCSAIVTHL